MLTQAQQPPQRLALVLGFLFSLGGVTADSNGGHMNQLRVLLVGPIEASGSMVPLLSHHHFDSSWERLDAVRPASIRNADVIIADIGLRGDEGRDFVRRLTTMTPKRPLVIVISNESEVTPEEPGIDLQLRKPVNPDELLAVLRRLSYFYMAAGEDVFNGDGLAVASSPSCLPSRSR
jgi:CheY-like chemotaxis protein